LIGICVNGDWIPTEYLQASATVDVLVGLADGASWGGGELVWILRLDDGRSFKPLGGLPTEFQVGGLRVTLTGRVRIDLVSPGLPIVEILEIN
jgi:hypothetical protein